MSLERLDEHAIKRVGGPAWEPLRDAFLRMSETLLNVSAESAGVLTTIYVKYQVSSAPNACVFAVAWLKNSKNIVLGLALPEDMESPMLGPAPVGMKYKGITKYLTIRPTETLPSELPQWAADAYKYAQVSATL
jgi:hypothetical protein